MDEDIKVEVPEPDTEDFNDYTDDEFEHQSPESNLDMEVYVSDVLESIMKNPGLNQLFSHQSLDIYQWLLSLVNFKFN